MNGTHYIGIPYGARRAVVFPYPHKPTRKELGIRFALIDGPYTKSDALRVGQIYYGPVAVETWPLAK